ncbi:CAMK/CAMKL/CHK1 protein kinase [Irpex rosettiformis]|uniref:CAMK/CAMKL/CHK1 protein kinase n=1 Tax=Irpex rosettiformis TaxID=378272 RepID=A0ACB8TNM0_9APHY|nr:CAMK/CAMKL/CHK1 protein kinase [Irpex rosettiformis]
MSDKLRFPKIDGFQLVQEIGGGGFSTVYRAVNIANHRVAACKMVTLTMETTEAERKTLDKEMRVHTALKHKNVLEFFNAFVVEPKKPSPYHPGIYMLLELAAGGDLFDKIAPDVGVREDIAQHYFHQLAVGLEYIHGEGICHRDLKPENILLDAAGTLKISDFGLSAVYKLKENGKTRLLNERCGSMPYVAPELNSNIPYEAEPIDVWGIGVILFTLLSGSTPWDEPTQKSYEYQKYLTGELFNDDPWNRFGREALELITGILAPDPSKRMTLPEIFRHSWMRRPSTVVTRGGLSALAEGLTESLRQNGDLEIATPSLSPVGRTDRDGDQIMLTAAYQSQFTQSLMLFSQTQAGRRYTPVLTRFYSSLLPGILLPLITESLTDLKVKWKVSDPKKPTDGAQRWKMRVGGFDKRKLIFKGTIELEEFENGDHKGTFCVMHRDQGNPISWRTLWKSLIMSPAVEPHVYKKQ